MPSNDRVLLTCILLIMVKRYLFLDIVTVFYFVFIKECNGEIQSFTNYGNGWVSSGYHASFGSDSEPEMHMDLSDFDSPLNPFLSPEQSGYSSNSYSSSYFESSRFPSNDINNPMFNSGLSGSRSNLHISSASWPLDQDFSSSSFDTSRGTYVGNLGSVEDKIKEYISSSADKKEFNNGNDYMKISEINAHRNMADALKELNDHGLEKLLPFASHTEVASKFNYPGLAGIFSKSKGTSFKIPSSSSTPAPSRHVLTSSNATKKKQNIKKIRYRPNYNKTLTTLQPAITDHNTPRSFLGQTNNHTESSSSSSRLSGTYVISPNNKNNSLSSDSLISSKHKNSYPRVQVQNHSDISKNEFENINTTPVYISMLSNNQSNSSNNTNTRQNKKHGRITDDFYTSSDYFYVKEYQTSDSRFRDLLVGLTNYNRARSRRHYNNHYYNDEFYRNRVSLANNNVQVNSAQEIATCALNIKEDDEIILLKIPCEIVSTFTDGSHTIEATIITKTTVCATNTTILNNTASELKEKVVEGKNPPEIPAVVNTEILIKTTTTVPTINTTENLTNNSKDINTTIRPKHKTTDKFYKSLITKSTTVPTLKIATTSNSPVDNITMDLTFNSKNTDLSSKAGVNNVQDAKITSLQHQGLKLVTVTTCTTEVTDPLTVKGASINTTNMECNVEIHTQKTFLRYHVNCRKLLTYAKRYKS